MLGENTALEPARDGEGAERKGAVAARSPARAGEGAKGGCSTTRARRSGDGKGRRGGCPRTYARGRGSAKERSGYLLVFRSANQLRISVQPPCAGGFGGKRTTDVFSPGPSMYCGRRGGVMCGCAPSAYIVIVFSCFCLHLSFLLHRHTVLCLCVCVINYIYPATCSPNGGHGSSGVF